MNISFTENSSVDYLYWQNNDMTIIRKINKLIKNIKRTPFEGIGKPESLKYDLAGYWLRRIIKEHRLVYQVLENETIIYTCRYHYECRMLCVSQCLLCES